MVQANSIFDIFLFSDKNDLSGNFIQSLLNLFKCLMSSTTLTICSYFVLIGSLKTMIMWISDWCFIVIIISHMMKHGLESLYDRIASGFKYTYGLLGSKEFPNI